MKLFDCLNFRLFLRIVSHLFRLENRIGADGTNTVYLLDDHEHSYGSWIITTYPDCESGEEKRVCGICRATESRALAGKGHSYENGYCTDCGAEHPELADYSGKVISIMGDSISTFAGYIPVADGFNMEHLARYPQDNLLTDVNETWWMQVVAELDAKLGINDSWRGATLSGGAPVTTGTTGENAAMSNMTRIQNLGSNGTPDVILLYGGTNDLAHVSKVGSFDPANAPTEVDLTTKKWDNLADGFLHTILRMRHYYPDAVIRYVLSHGFVMTEKSEVEAVRVSGLLDGAVLYETFVEATELTVTVDGGVLDVTGYDLSKSYIAQDHAGDKLVITISNVEATDAVLWNENMDISTADSGIWADGAMAVAFAKGSAFFRRNVHVMDYAQQITLDEENVIHLDADGMGCFGEAGIRLEMTCGTAVVEEDGVVYTPGTMQWNGYDRFYAFAKKNETYSWTKVAVIPANNVYYEDSFVATSDEDAAAGAGIYYTNGTKPEDVAQDVWDSWNGQWESVSDNKTGNSVENSSDVQGWIENLAGQTGFTGGSAHLVQAMVGQRVDSFPKATFTFTGTGVDIYSFINNTTGMIMVQVSDVKGTYPSKYYLMDISANTAEGYYQVPTISFVGMGYSTYQVTIMVTSAAASKNRFAYYLDGIRVYNPLGEDAKDETVEDAYGDENHAVFGSVRQMLLDAGSFTGETGEGTGFVFIDQLPDSENSGSTNMIGTYETYGPKNEVYLAKGQAIAFKVDENLYSRVQVGLKSLTGEEVQAVVSYFDEESNAAAQGMVSIPHTADLYYELMPMEGYVVIRNTSDAILAVTKVKLMVSGDPQQISAQVEKVSQAEVLEAVDEFDALPMMTYRLRNFRPDVEITQPEASPEELAMVQMRALIEKIFGSVRKWFD